MKIEGINRLQPAREVDPFDTVLRIDPIFRVVVFDLKGIVSPILCDNQPIQSLHIPVIRADSDIPVRGDVWTETLPQFS